MNTPDRSVSTTPGTPAVRLPGDRERSGCSHGQESDTYHQDAARAALRAACGNTPLPDVVRDFLNLHWYRLLARFHRTPGPDSEAWAAALGTVDSLLESLEPRRHPADRRRLANQLPLLLKRLDAGIALLRLDTPTRQQFLDALCSCHTRALAGQAPLSPVAGMEVEHLGLATDALAATSGRAHPALAAWGSVVEDQDPYARQVRELREGDWVGWQERDPDSARQILQLRRIDAKTGTYQFAGQRGNIVLERSSYQLTREFRTGQLARIEAPGT